MTLPQVSSCPCCSAFRSQIPTRGRCPGSVSQLGSACRLVSPSPGRGCWVFWAPALTHTVLWTCRHVSLRGPCYHFSLTKPGSPVYGGCLVPTVGRAGSASHCFVSSPALSGLHGCPLAGGGRRVLFSSSSVLRVAVYSACTVDKPDVQCLACKSTVRCFTNPGTYF